MAFQSGTASSGITLKLVQFTIEFRKGGERECEDVYTLCVSLRMENDRLMVLLQEGRMPGLWSISEVWARGEMSCLRRLRLSRMWCK